MGNGNTDDGGRDTQDNENRKLKIEEDKLKIERDKLDLERSWKKVWSAPLLAAVVTVGVTGLTLLINHHQSSIANQQAAAAEKQQEGQWGISVLELYITQPDAFDPVKSPHANQNLSALAVSAPDVMKPILLARQDALVRLGDLVTSSELQAVAGALGALQSAHGSGSDGPPGKGTALPDFGKSLLPAAYSIYVQYGPNSADEAETVVNKLRGDGFRVPDPQLVEKSSSNPEVRYYSEDQKNLADSIAQNVGKGAQAVFVGDNTLRLGNILEVWLP